MFFKKNDKENDLAKIAALLIYAAKIDQNYSNSEEKIIKQALIQLGAKESNINEIINLGKEIENNSNQILDFTKKVKNMDDNDKIKIIK